MNLIETKFISAVMSKSTRIKISLSGYFYLFNPIMPEPRIDS